RNSQLQRCTPAYRRSRSLDRGSWESVPAVMPVGPLSRLLVPDEMRPTPVSSLAIRQCLPLSLMFRHKAQLAELRSSLHSQATSFIENLQSICFFTFHYLKIVTLRILRSTSCLTSKHAGCVQITGPWVGSLGFVEPLPIFSRAEARKTTEHSGKMLL